MKLFTSRNHINMRLNNTTFFMVSTCILFFISTYVAVSSVLMTFGDSRTVFGQILGLNSCLGLQACPNLKF